MAYAVTAALDLEKPHDLCERSLRRPALLQLGDHVSKSSGGLMLPEQVAQTCVTNNLRTPAQVLKVFCG